MSEHSQGKTEQNITFLNRLTRLRGKTGATWAEIGKLIGLSRTMLHHLRKGENEPSQRTLGQLEQAEIDAGVRQYSSGRQGILRWIESTVLPDLNILPRDHDAGVVHVSVEFRRGSVPARFEGTVPVNAPSAAIAANLLMDVLHDDDVEKCLRQCLPPKYASAAFLNQLEPESFLRLLHAALEMSLGTNWRERVMMLLQRKEAYSEVKKTEDPKNKKTKPKSNEPSIAEPPS